MDRHGRSLLNEMGLTPGEFLHPGSPAPVVSGQAENRLLTIKALMAATAGVVS